MAKAVMQQAGTRRAVHWKSLRTSVLLSVPALIKASAPHLRGGDICFGGGGEGGELVMNACAHIVHWFWLFGWWDE